MQSQKKTTSRYSGKAAARPARRWVRLGAVFMSLCLVGTMIPITASADDDSVPVGMCVNHPEHTQECVIVECGGVILL